MHRIPSPGDFPPQTEVEPGRKELQLPVHRLAVPACLGHLLFERLYQEFAQGLVSLSHKYVYHGIP
jgi:hypothetical protein